MESLIWILFIWTMALFLWTWIKTQETKDALELTKQSREVLKDNLRMLSVRNEVRLVSLITKGGDVKTYSARGYSHSEGYFSIFDKDGNEVLKISDDDIEEVRLTRDTEYTYIDPEIYIGNRYVRGGLSHGSFIEYKGGD